MDTMEGAILFSTSQLVSNNNDQKCHSRNSNPGFFPRDISSQFHLLKTHLFSLVILLWYFPTCFLGYGGSLNMRLTGASDS